MSSDMNNLSQAQQAVVNKIIDIGKEMGVSDELIQVAVNIANAETNLGVKFDNPDNPTVHGLYQYKDATFDAGWEAYRKLHQTDTLAQLSGAQIRLGADYSLIADAQTKVMYMDLIGYDRGYDQGIIATNWEPGENRYGDTVTLLGEGINIKTNFLAYSFLRHCPDADQVIKVVNTAFTLSNLAAAQNLVEERGLNSGVIPGSNLFNPTTQDFLDAEGILFDLDLYPDGSLFELQDTYIKPFYEWSTNELLSYDFSSLYSSGWMNDLSFDPIGAFYEVQDLATDNAPSIADKTGVVTNADGSALTRQQLQAKDTNIDGKLSGSELNYLQVWQDINENGKAESGEIKTLSGAGITEIKEADYKFYTQGNATPTTDAGQQAPTIDYNYYRNLVDFKYVFEIVPVYTNHLLSGPTVTTYYSPLANSAGEMVYVDGVLWIFESSEQTGSVEDKHTWLATEVKVSQDRTTMTGTDGSDSFWTNYYIDIDGSSVVKMLGGGGDDAILGNSLTNQIWGGTGNDELQGQIGNDTLVGEAGNDKMFGQVGDDVLHGGEGNDTLVGFTATNESKQTLNAGETDNDKVYGGAGNDLLYGGLGGDTLYGGLDDDELQGKEGNDLLYGEVGNDRVFGQVGDDVLYGGEGNDVLVGFTGSNETKQTLSAGETSIHGTGNKLNNTIIGNSGNNILDGVTGADTMTGGKGNDTYYVDNSGDCVIEHAGEGTDTLQSSISYTIGDNAENLILLDYGKPEKGNVDDVPVLVYGYPKRNELDYMQGDKNIEFQGTCALTSISNLLVQVGKKDANGNYITEESVVSLASNNDWTVNDPAKPSYERGGSNYIQQMAILDSYGIQNDIISGYNEQGTANLIRGGRGVIIAVNAGELWDDPAYQGNGGVNHVVTITGVVYGEQDGDLIGFYIADSGRSKVTDMTRYISIEKFREAANVDAAYSIYTIVPLKLWEEDINGTGSELNNLLIGNRGDNALLGNGGNDTLEGGDGNDTLDGGAGTDILVGGTGDDAYVIDNADDTITELANEGTDTVISSVSWTIGSSIENLMLADGDAINGWGNTLDNSLIGNGNANVLNGGAGNDFLDGAGGVDSMSGGLGDDTYLVDAFGETTTENPNEGVETVYAAVSHTLAADLEYLVLFAEAITATGNASDNLLIGNALDNTLTGLAGGDWLEGGLGADSMLGGQGSDTYIVDSTDDVVTENASQGIDIMFSSVTNTLSANVERLTLTGIAANATGNDLNNVLTGNEANNAIDGKGGSDTMIGGMGNDSYTVNHAGDVVIELYEEGVDKVKSSISYTLGESVEDLTLINAPAALNAIGNNLANTITGNNNGNTLNGKEGNDSLTGGAGQDTFVFDTAVDVTANVDTITDFTVVDDTIHLEDTVFTSLATTGALNAANFMIGDAAADSDDYLIYNSTTGALSYDADGSGSGAAAWIALLGSGQQLSNADFVVI